MPDGGFGFFDRRWFRPAPDGGFDVAIPSGVRAILGDMMGDLDELLSSDSENVRRVFPTAYPDDADKEAGYQALVRGELIDRHRSSAEVIAATIDADHLTDEELTSWMTAINALRLVFGTALDVSEDDDPAIDPDDPDAPARIAYRVLTELVDDIVQALSTTL
jgi:hypothetical protein